MHKFHPSLDVTDYEAFPAVYIEAPYIKNPAHAGLDLYDVFMIIEEEQHDISQSKITRVNMVPCNRLADAQFQKGGFYHEKNSLMKNEHILCPERDDFSFSGIKGTNLYVVPKKSELYDLTVDPKPY